jgi:hypothetical protein
MGLFLPRDLDRRFLETLINMWENPEKRMALEADGRTEEMINEARESLAKMGV